MSQSEIDPIFYNTNPMTLISKDLRPQNMSLLISSIDTYTWKGGGGQNESMSMYLLLYYIFKSNHLISFCFITMIIFDKHEWKSKTENIVFR